MGLLMFVAALALLAFLALVVWRGTLLHTVEDKPCPACGADIVEVEDPRSDGHRSYQVFACTRCDHAETTVHGSRSLLSYCPACKQLSLETTAVTRHDASQGSLGVDIEESCALCGHHEQRHLLGAAPHPSGDSEPRDGKVIPFPGDRRRGG